MDLKITKKSKQILLNLTSTHTRTLTLRPQQIETADFLMNNPRSFCFSGMGAAKTVASLSAAVALHNAGLVKNILIICTLGTINSVWADTLRNEFNMDPVIIRGSKFFREQQLSQPNPFKIINHDGIKTDTQAHLAAAQFDLIIIDEATRLNYHMTKMSRAFRDIAQHALFVWALTATPCAENYFQAYGLAAAINPVETKKKFSSFTKFKEHIAYPHPYRKFKWEFFPHAEQVVADLLQPSIRFTTEEVFKLPKLTTKLLHVRTSNGQDKALRALATKVMDRPDGTKFAIDTPSGQAIKRLQISEGFYYVPYEDGTRTVTLTSIVKRKALIRLTEKFPKESFIITAWYPITLKRLAEYYGDDARVIYGAVPQAERDQIIADFQAKKFRYLFIQPRCCAHGISLTAARFLVFISPIYSQELFDQITKRPHRPGQTRDCYRFLLYNTNFERDVYQLLMDKQLTQKRLMRKVDEYE